MAGESEKDEAQKLWDQLAKEREAGEQSPSKLEAVKPEAEEAVTEDDAAAKVVADKKAEEGTEKDATAAVDDKSKAVAEPDPYEGLSPALKARLQKLEALETQVTEIPKLQQQVKTAEGRVAAMQREFDVAKNAAKAVNDAPSTAQIAAAKASTEKWESLKSDFPEWADATEQFVKAQLAGLTPQQAQRLDPKEVEAIVEQRVAAVRAETLKAVEEARVDGKHPNWRDEVKSDLFVKWFDAQAEDVKKLSASTDGRDAIRMLDLFAEAKATPAKDVQQQRAAKLAAAVGTKPGAAAPTAKTVDQMNDAELWEYERKRAAKKGEARGLTY